MDPLDMAYKSKCLPFNVFIIQMEKLRTNIEEPIPHCTDKLVLELEIDLYLKMMKWKNNATYILIVPSLYLASGMFCIYAGNTILLEDKELSGWIC